MQSGVATAKLVESHEYCAVAAVICLRIALHVSGTEGINRSQFFTLMEQCKSVVIGILRTPEGKSSGSLETLMKLPFCSMALILKRRLNWLKINRIG